jgi:hypothetical protein
MMVIASIVFILLTPIGVVSIASIACLSLTPI